MVLLCESKKLLNSVRLAVTLTITTAPGRLHNSYVTTV